MKKICFLFLLLVSVAIQADPRIEIRDNFCHFPQDEFNQDIEHFISDCGGMVFVQEDGTARGYARVEIRTFTNYIKDTFFGGDIGSTPCVMVDSNGVTYTTTSYTNAIYVGSQETAFILSCSGGVPQEAAINSTRLRAFGRRR